MKNHSKRFQEAQKIVKPEEKYEWSEAFRLLLEMPSAKFDESVEVAIRLSADPKQGDQMVRGTVELPNGSGKTVRVVAFTEDEKVAESALAAGAEFAGLKPLIDKIKAGWVDFDVAVATTGAMSQVKTIARVLGPRGLMPSPKAGTVSDDLVSCISAVKQGRVEFKMDKTANLHLIIGKRSFGVGKLQENAEAAIKAVVNAKPKAVKGKFILNVTLSSTMSPSLTLSPSLFSKF